LAVTSFFIGAPPDFPFSLQRTPGRPDNFDIYKFVYYPLRGTLLGHSEIKTHHQIPFPIINYKPQITPLIFQKLFSIVDRIFSK